MKRAIEQLEHLVEREMDVFSRWPTPGPRAESVARVQQAVRAEAARYGHSATSWQTWPRWAGVAAALLLAVGLSGVFQGHVRPAEPASDASEMLALWTEAVGQSSDRIGYLLADGWIADDTTNENGEPMDRLLDSLDASFEQLGTL